MTEKQPGDAADAEPERKQRVFTEEAKQLQVSHWDWDYLPTEEIERQMQQDPKPPNDRGA